MSDEDDFLRKESERHKVSAKQRTIVKKSAQRPLHELVKSAFFKRKNKTPQK